MDAMLQRHCARYIYVVPDGLRELMSDISREVLRSQPEDLCTFIADYLDALLITRENARVAAKFVQNLTDTVETTVDLLKKCGLSREEADRAAEVIQEAFKSWISRKGILKEDEDAIIAQIIEKAEISEFQAQDAAICIQTAFREFKMRKEKERRLLEGIIDWRVAARSAIKLYRRTGVSPEEAKRAANLIKAAYKGYYTRRMMKKLNEMNESIAVEVEEEEEEESSEDILSFTSGQSEKKKGVRIDYQSVVPHVDFGDEEVIAKEVDAESIDGETEEQADVKLEEHEETKDTPGKISSEEFIKGILDKYVLSPIDQQVKEDERKPTEDEAIAEVLPEEETPTELPPEIITESTSTQVPSKAPLIETQIKVASEEPTELPLKEPTKTPSTEAPTELPSKEPNKTPSTEAPTELPSKEPTKTPSTEAPTELPSKEPTKTLSTETPTELSSKEATEALTGAPSEKPTEAPTELPSEQPAEASSSDAPTELQSKEPNEAPSEQPTKSPTEELTEVSSEVTTEITTETTTEELKRVQKTNAK